MNNFYTDVLTKLPLFNSPNRVSSLDYLEPFTRNAVHNIIYESALLNKNLMVFETYRSPRRQKALFDQGATQLEHVGVHGFGLACDLVKSIGGEPCWKGDFSFLGALARKHGLIWGGDWGAPIMPHEFIDSCHVQRVSVFDQSKLFLGTWYPVSSSYDPYKIVVA